MQIQIKMRNTINTPQSITKINDSDMPSIGEVENSFL